MPKITYVHPDARTTTLDGVVGDSVMETAVAGEVPEIVAECGGNMQCATCHVYVDEAWAERIPEADDDEDAMLDETVLPRQPTSRLSCQLRVSDAIDGLVVRLPERQT
ncbi:2Fe-2S iron-sulfur cluster-binding protein [Conexibacter sp. CPCC 206217]|uniref:2Fe-2S iron-sulfur cluster-binding protein n=1 Tax=Conexibacter sp. CPCC 206217 TaxID=3064574 RepID=UPI0027157CC3|nr:2Fe-2S iron-sulfur cluster-binding protein [Conexibacter sp. CPCC 206217]MDO8212561.1 2Fe-2S iron-sulfur cluster-binding protein [Conexibacter sp. CPCC 206217]